MTRAKPSAWLTPREAARVLGWTDPQAAERLTRALRRAENASGTKVLQVVHTPQRTRLLVSLAGVRKALPHLFVTSREHLPVAINERFDEVLERIDTLASRSGAHGSAIRGFASRLSALEALARKIERGELRLVKGGRLPR